MDYKPKILIICFTTLLQTVEFGTANSVLFDIQVLWILILPTQRSWLTSSDHQALFSQTRFYEQNTNGFCVKMFINFLDTNQTSYSNSKRKWFPQILAVAIASLSRDSCLLIHVKVLWKMNKLWLSVWCPTVVNVTPKCLNRNTKHAFSDHIAELPPIYIFDIKIHFQKDHLSSRGFAWKVLTWIILFLISPVWALVRSSCDTAFYLSLAFLWPVMQCWP